MQLLYVAKETVPPVVGELMAEVFLEKGGEWPRGEAAFEKDFALIYRRLKYDKYEGGSARCKAVRVMADKVLASRGDESLREQAVRWGCETLELDLEEFADLAREQGTFELQTNILEGLLGTSSIHPPTHLPSHPTICTKASIHLPSTHLPSHPTTYTKASTHPPTHPPTYSLKQAPGLSPPPRWGTPSRQKASTSGWTQ